MNEVTLDEILVAAHDAEFSQFDNSTEHQFSHKHNRAMKRIFKAYEKKALSFKHDASRIEQAAPYLRWNRKTVTMVLMIILLAALTGCTTVIYCLGGFKTDVQNDNTQLFAIDLEDCPQNIEEIYYLSEIPDSFELIDESISSFSVYKQYISTENNKTITLHQFEKTVFATHYNTEYSSLEEISIGEHIGIGLQCDDTYIVVWDNGDYILEIVGTLTKNEVINLAKSAKVLEN